jgi:hypothetical protein
VPPLDLQTALDLTARIVACGLALSALELLSIRHHFGRQGVFGLGTVSPFHRQLATLRVIDRYVALLLSLQFVASVALVVLGPFSPLGRLVLIVAFLATTLARWRRHTGGDGAEQMALLVLGAVGLAVLPWPWFDRMVVAATFIAAQASLSYVTAGVAKLVSPAWRSGSALPAILSTYSHGHPLAARLLHQNVRLAQLACWTVIVFECLFPLLVLGPGWLVVAALVCGFTFHAGCAVLMGLNSFLWSFPATYPCVIAAVAYWKLWAGIS